MGNTTTVSMRELRKRKGLTQQDLASHLQVTRQTISNIELGKVVPDLLQARSIANILGVSVDEIEFGIERHAG